KLKEYWKNRLSGAPTLNLPADFPRPQIPTLRGVRRAFVISEQLLRPANDLFAACGTTPYRGLLAIFNVFVHCYSVLSDILVGSPSMPTCRGIAALTGFFVNTVVFRTDLSGDPPLRKLMRRVDVGAHRPLAHADLNFNQIVEAVQPPRDPSRTP